MRLDLAASKLYPDWSRTRLQGLIRAGAVSVNGVAVTRPSHEVASEDAIVIAADPTPPAPPPVGAEAIPLEVLYEDDDLAVIHKPAGLLVHPGAGQQRGTLVNALLHRYGALSGVGGAARPGIVHRLDRTTSGLMVVARNDVAHRKLGRQFQARTVSKQYLALAHGLLQPAEGEIALPIGRDLNHRKRMTTRRPEPHSRAALTRYRTLQSFPAPAGTPAAQRATMSFSWLEVAIHTGRTHQIRVHLAALGHPVVGDRLYGAPAVLAGPGALAGQRPERVFLHAAALAFDHPRSGERLSFAQAPPAAMTELLHHLAPGIIR